MPTTFDPLSSSAPFHKLFDLTGTTAIVTGAGSVGPGIGIGRASAILLADAGARVGLLDIDRAAAEETHRMISRRGGTSLVAIADLADDRAVLEAVSQVVANFGPVNTLVNNVGIVGPGGTAEFVDLEAWDAGMRVNVKSMVIASRHVVPIMRSAGGGSIVNISSIAGLGGGYPSLFYPTSKGTIINLTKAMATQHGRDGIRVNTVAPGQVLTPRIEMRGLSTEMRAARNHISALGIEGTGWDPAYAVVFLASRAARWITGVVLPVDGGVTGTLPLESPPSK
ncbi:SDR family oxidoreductase [Cryobacterium sp. TMT1-2-2]|uniref:SDR family NAD(P)-dependent oxidoreductase n=1 Tax=Cryobacterium sp. TMT1-2-2 TaxID=1259233 RepID=UPI0010699BB6|nr:SDR family NAD(P)-dependent oxidoreductase [Cryobacterium sp. TMT1-2-2]TFD15322.1 SDR family oxidoreductase [Cryobacterium sp. TMT1-2-2]